MSRVCYFFQFADNPATRQPGKFSASILPSVPYIMKLAVKTFLLNVYSLFFAGLGVFYSLGLERHFRGKHSLVLFFLLFYYIFFFFFFYFFFFVFCFPFEC